MENKKPSMSTGRKVMQVVWAAFLLDVAWTGVRVLWGGASVRGAVSGPETVAEERVVLEEGTSKSYGFTVSSQRKIEITVSASPRAVNVITMEHAAFEQFQAANDTLLGGSYQYLPSLSSQSVTSYHQVGVLPPGRWHVVVQRPRESLVFGQGTNANVKILAH